MARRGKFAPDYEAKAVLKFLLEGKNPAQANREYGIKDAVLSRWCKALIERFPRYSNLVADLQVVYSDEIWVSDITLSTLRIYQF